MPSPWKHVLPILDECLVKPPSLRLAAAGEGNTVYFDLRVGERLVGNYDPIRGRWNIQRPYHLFVGERTLPGL